MRLCINMLIFTHNLGNWLMEYAPRNNTLNSWSRFWHVALCCWTVRTHIYFSVIETCLYI